MDVTLLSAITDTESSFRLFVVVVEKEFGQFVAHADNSNALGKLQA